MLDKFGQFFAPKKSTAAASGLDNPTGGPGNGEKEAVLNGAVLEKAFDRLSTCPADKRYALQMSLYQQLIGSMVLIPVPKGTDTRQSIPLMTLENERGETGVPVFTSEEAMAMWVSEETEYVGLPFPMLCTHAVQANLDFVVLNLAGPAGGELTHYEFSYLAENLIPPPREDKSGEFVLEKDTEVRLGPADDLSPILLERLTALFSQRADLIDRVYAFQVAFSQGPMKTGIGVCLKKGSGSDPNQLWETELWPNVRAVLQEVLGAKEYVNVFLLNALPELEETVGNVSKPFYKS